MKFSTLLFVLVSALISPALLGQCDLIVFSNTNFADCYGGTHTINFWDSNQCNDASYIEYSYALFDADDNLIGTPETGEFPANLNFPQLTFNSDLEVSYSCCTFSAYSLDEQLLDETTECFEDIPLPGTPTLNDILVFSCDGNCIDYSTNVSGNWSFDVLDVDEGEGVYFGYCFTEPGTYTIQATSWYGCVFEEDITVGDIAPENNETCETALPIESGSMVSDEFCGFVSTTQCSFWGGTNFRSNWFTFNSESTTHLTVGIGIEDIYSYSLDLLKEGDEPGCENLEIVNCGYTTEIPMCVSYGDSLLLEPNTNYYLRLNGYQAMSYDITIGLSNDLSESICGCTDPESCMYNPDAIIDTGCWGEGCIDPEACNYSQWALCDDGSCVYGENLVAQLYHDLNGDGNWQQGGFFPEPSLGNVGSITINELGVTLFPDNDGSFSFPEVPLGVYTLVFNDGSDVWELTTAGEISMTLPTCNGAEIGLTPTNETMLQVSGPCCIWAMDIHCENGFNPGLWIENTGTVPLNGTFVMTFDPMFVPEYLDGVQPYDSYSNGTMVWNIVDQAPGEAILYQCHIQGPGVDNLGEVFDFNMDLDLVDGEGNPFYNQTWLLQPEILCAYDPNDKYAVPEGYTENHFVLTEDEIEYRVRFQNTGNAPATDVRIEDQLDLSTLDITSFEPIFASHNFTTALHDDGLVEFFFDNIDLPDSTSDFAASQGYVVYKIRTLPNLDMNEVINNTAEIYFDANPEIVTNTTWHTIFDCESLVGLGEDASLCTGDAFTFDLSQEFVESYEWTINGEVITADDGILELGLLDEASELDISLTLANPLCTEESSMILTVDELPEAGIIFVGDFTLEATEGESYVWYLDGEEIEGETGSQLIFTESGNYSVAITNGSCTSLSDDFFANSINETSLSGLSLYPNPVTASASIQLPKGNYGVVIFNSVGQTQMVLMNQQGTIELDLAKLASGIYEMLVFDDQQSTTIRFVKK